MIIPRRLALLASVPLLAACGTTPELGEAAQPIIGGTVDNGDPAVVLLVSYSQDHQTLDTCSAAVISPTVLLTAAHCVDAANHPGFGYGAFLGADASAYPDVASFLPVLATVKEVHAHPSYDPNPPFKADIGVVVLDKPLNVAALPMNRDPLMPALVGQTARILGYGQTVYGQYNAIKHQASTVVVSIGPDDTVVVGDAVKRSCIGDSGGPALVMMAGVETIVGVDSYSETTGCIDPANYRRTDSYLPFLDTYAPPSMGTGGAGGSGGSTTASSTGSSAGATTTSSGAGGASASSSSGSMTTSSGTGGAATTSGGDAPTKSGGCAVSSGEREPRLLWVLPLLAGLALLRRRR